MFYSREKLTAFKMRLELWHQKLDRKNFASFPQLNMFIDENVIQVGDDIVELMKQHVSILGREIFLYFPDFHGFDKYFRFIRNSFVLSVSDLPTQDNSIQDQFIDLVNDRGEKCFSCEMCCSDFWIEMARSYFDVVKVSLKVLMPFPTTYECETPFSTFLANKTKSRNQLDVTPEMRVALFKTEPIIEALVTLLGPESSEKAVKGPARKTFVKV
ncbi:zinc finger BED domain-containing protein 5 [Octopus bimaculoides]|uniref:zinc finger BED domain-containing protein 5 n=1 Tax=Octopus bimaculoides TaxID=37653 RepID=UPI00071CEB40|nr:zinc finger BED domain-containing protein 5 [Octopus bimaculoides]|eukprot:XP_014776045.1 PREDICTED: zinc finger BED domain-containing protein 5-like [Octopus bimaculoides]